MLPLTARSLTRWDEKNAFASLPRMPVVASPEKKSLEVNCGLLGGFLGVENVHFKIPRKLDYCVATDYGKSIMDIFATDGTMLEESPIVPKEENDKGLRRFLGLTSTDDIGPSMAARIPVAMKSSSTLMEELLDGHPPVFCSVNISKPTIEALCASRFLAMEERKGLNDEDRESAVDRLLFAPTTDEPDDHPDPMANINSLTLWLASCMNAPSHQEGSRLWMQSTDSPFIPTTLHLDMVDVRTIIQIQTHPTHPNTLSHHHNTINQPPTP